MAEYPGSAYTPNPQSTANDSPGDATIANGADYNKHDDELQAVTDDLRAAIAAGTGADMAAVVTNLVAADITTPGVGNTVPGDLALWDDTDGTALRQGNAINGPISVSNETVNPLNLGDGELASTNGDLSITADQALNLTASGDQLVLSDSLKSTSGYTGAFQLSEAAGVWSYLVNLFGERSLLRSLYSSAVGGTERAILVEDCYATLGGAWTVTGASHTETPLDLVGGVTDFESGATDVVSVASVQALLRREQNAMLDVRFQLDQITDLSLYIRIINLSASFLQLTSASANFFVACSNGGVTAVDTGIAAATGTWYRLIIEESSSNVVFRLAADTGAEAGDVYPDVVATITTNLPTASEARGVSISLTDTAASSKTLKLDWIRCAADREA